MGKTISFVKGKGSLRHNNREFIADNVDRTRTRDNVTYIRMSLEEAYEHCFGDALREYNAHQKRKDRQKNSYIEEIRNSGNREKVFYENVIQIGTMKDTPVIGEDGNLTPQAQEAIAVLDQYVRSFQERNPNLFLFNAVLHLDEATPHLHLDYIPVAHGYKRGLKVRNSLTKALQEMGFEKGKSRNDNETIDWQHREREYISSLCAEHGIEVIVLGEDRDNYSLPEYKEIMHLIAEKEAEIEILNQQKDETETEITALQEEQTELLEEVQDSREQIEKELAAAKDRLSGYQLTRDTIEAVEEEVRAKVDHVRSQVIPSRNLLDKEEYVKVPRRLWSKMLSAYEWACRQKTAISRLTSQVKSLRSKVSELSRQLESHQRFLKSNSLLQAFEEFLHPQKRSIIEQLKGFQDVIQVKPSNRAKEFDLER